MQVICYLPIPKSGTKKLKSKMELGLVPHIKNCDIDNLAKNLLDCMTKLGFWKDDRQVFDLHIVKRYEDGNGPRWWIKLETEE